MIIFLTGGSGFIGQNFINKALKNNFKIYAITRNKAIVKSEKRAGINWIYGDLSQNYDKYFKECDVFLHLAAHGVVDSSSDFQEYYMWNVEQPIKLANSAINCGIKKFLIIGSCSEYGYSANKYQYIPEDAELIPHDNYSLSKAIASMKFKAIAIKHNIKLNILRLFHVFGEGENNKRLWKSLKIAASNGEDIHITKGEQIRDFSHVSYVVTKIVDFCSFESIISGEPVIKNIGSGNVLSVKQFSNYWWKEFNASGKIYYDLPYRKDELMRVVPKLN